MVLKDFFPTITWKRVKGLFAAIHDREKGKPGKADESLAQLEGMAARIYMSDPKKGAAFLAKVRALAAHPLPAKP